MGLFSWANFIDKLIIILNIPCKMHKMIKLMYNVSTAGPILLTRISWTSTQINANLFGQMGHGRLISTLATAVSGEGVCKILGPPGLKLASRSWSNLLIVGIYPAASAQKHPR